MTREDAQREVDRLSMEINEMYRELREKESERARYDRVANPGDWTRLPAEREAQEQMR